MWRIVLLLALAPVADAQIDSKPVDWSKHIKVSTAPITLPIPHIHPHSGKCKGAADGVCMRSGRTYYACIGQKDVCSEEKGRIPRSYITAFDARMDAHNARMREFKAAMKQRRASREPAQETNGPSVPAPASPSQPKPAVPDERVAAIAAGASADEVITLLGEPHARLTGDFQRFTYRLASGATARLEFEQGRLTRTQLTPAP